MSKTSVLIIIYIIGLIFGAIVLKIWSADTSILKGLLGLGWTALLLIGIFFAEKNEKDQIPSFSFFYAFAFSECKFRNNHYECL